MKETICVEAGKCCTHSLNETFRSVIRQVLFLRGRHTSSLVSTNGMGKSFSNERYRAPNWKSRPLNILAALDEAVCSHALEAKVQQSSIICRKTPGPRRWRRLPKSAMRHRFMRHFGRLIQPVFPWGVEWKSNGLGQLSQPFTPRAKNLLCFQ
ncbi:MAG TPA: hypothetical protein VNW47_08380 [Terriglobales bacterium]|jgi:hypothetical protein|nr:hypothetical protein [Terriglobales bacterium]